MIRLEITPVLFSRNALEAVPVPRFSSASRELVLSTGIPAAAQLMSANPARARSAMEEIAQLFFAHHDPSVDRDASEPRQIDRRARSSSSGVVSTNIQAEDESYSDETDLQYSSSGKVGR